LIIGDCNGIPFFCGQASIYKLVRTESYLSGHTHDEKQPRWVLSSPI
jgi:hypothetical protein